MDASDLLFLVGAALLAALWWRRCCSRAGGDAGDGLPPGPPGWPVVGNLFQVVLERRPFMYVVRDLRARYGPIFTLRMGQRTLVVVSSAELIHDALVRKGPLFASRPADSPTRLLFSVGKCTVNSAPYGPLWRALRRNFVAEIVSPARVRSFGWIRDWAIAAHLARLREQQSRLGAAQVMGACRLTVCSILACICFGARVPEPHVREIEEVLKDVMMMTTPKLPDFLPVLTPLFRGQLTAARALRRRQLDCLLPLVRARRAFVGDENRQTETNWEMEMVSPAGDAYVDSLFGLEPAGRGRLGEEELVTLCSEVMSAGTDTSATALEWALLHLVLDPAAQERLHAEVVAKAGPKSKGGKITEAHVEDMPYLQAVVKETLRRHPPSHFVLSHAVSKDEAELGGYRIPANASVEFYTAWVAEDPSVWTEPGEWRPERFLEGGEGWDTDVTGTRGVRMMPFGAGRRICPAATLGMLHVQLMLANMVREFRWTPAPGDQPDPTETFAFTVVMKNPLRAAIIEREHDNCTTAI
ncbi:Cytochrome P450 77A3 [Ananas comosus]|uniref:Cytochrome P450 77A3 n=1 Tax=Ananas comosus TaxID=4615 RepID=A0A199VE21_ANACO|nr:Cytochrome P450 77A3 [Ananas comosus]